MMTLRHLLFLIHCLPGSSNSVYWDAGINRLPCPLSSSWVSLKGTTDRSSQIEKERALHIHFPCIFLTWSWLCVCVCVCVCVLVTQLCPTLCDPVNCNSPGSSVQGILQARILEWVTISFSRAGHDWQ